jgi:hypothetical protein
MPDLKLSEEAFPTTGSAAVEAVELAPDVEDEMVEGDVEAVGEDEPQAAAEPEPEVVEDVPEAAPDTASDTADETA